LVLDRQYVIEAEKEAPNHVVGEEGPCCHGNENWGFLT